MYKGVQKKHFGIAGTSRNIALGTEVVSESVETVVPAPADVVEPGGGVVEVGRDDLVADLAPLAGSTDQAGGRKGRQMLHQGLTTHRVARRQLRRAQRAVTGQSLE
jgi:hypothetical protein